jgi:hypothetical protein
MEEEEEDHQLVQKLGEGQLEDGCWMDRMGEEDHWHSLQQQYEVLIDVIWRELLC